MTYGGQILRSDGSYWLTPDQTPLNLVKREDVQYTVQSNTVWYNTGVTSDRPCMIFIRNIADDGVGKCIVGYLVQQDGYWQFRIPRIEINSNPRQVTVRYYVFSNYVVNPQAYDIAYYNAQGQMTWNGSSRPLQLFRGTAQRIDLTYADRVIRDEGQTVAVMPSFSADEVETIIPGVPQIYYIAEYGYKASGNQIKNDMAYMLEDTSGSGYIGYYVGSYFYIRTQLYDY